MEDESMSRIDYVPTFARGLKLLLVHDDILSLMNLSSLLEQYSFNVTAMNEASAAVSMIYNHEGRFKLVVAKVNMPGIDALSFLDVLHEKDIPVIFISSGGFDDIAWRALSKGLCYFLEEPVHLKDLKYLWQHVYHSKTNSAKEAQNADDETINKKNKRVRLVEENLLKEFQNACIEQLMSTQCRAHRANGKGNQDDDEGKQREKETELSSALVDFDSCNHTAKESEERKNHKIGSAKKKRIVWTAELHQKFTKAISVLGDQKVRPREIQHEMNVPGLTIRQVASHLQKYKSQIKRFQIACNSDLPTAKTSANFGGRTIFPAPFESQSYLGLPSPTALLNVSQNQNQFLMTRAQTQESGVCKLLKTSGYPSFTNEFPTGLANYGSQSPDAIVGQPLPDASVDSNQPATECDDIIKMLEGDGCTSNCFHNGINQGDVDQYSDRLRTVLQNSSCPLEFDICNLSIS